MINFKRIFAFVLACAMLASLAACNKGENAVTTVPVTMEGATVPPMEVPDIDRGEEKINIAAPADATGLAFSKLIIDRSYAYNVEIKDVTSASAAEKIKNGEVEIAVVSLADAAKLAAEADIKILAVNSVVKLSLVENGDTLKDVSDLNGKTVYCGVTDAASQAVAKEIFDDNGTKVELIFASAADVEAKMKNSEATICIFAEPDATRIVSANGGYAKKADLTAAWKKDFAPIQSCIVVRADYAVANPETIMEFAEHIEMCSNSLLDEAGIGRAALQFVENGYFSSKELAEEAINSCGFVYIDGEEMQALIENNCKFLADNGVEITAPQF